MAVLRAVDEHADYAVRSDSIASLAASSDLVAYGSVMSTGYVDFNGLIYTRVSLRVDRAAGPSAATSRGQVVTVMEPGGVTTIGAMERNNALKAGETPTDTPASTPVAVRFDGMPLVRPGDRVVYFLAHGTLPIVQGPYYSIVGATQGKFDITGTSASRYVAPWDAQMLNPLATNLPALLDQASGAVRK